MTDKACQTSLENLVNDLSGLGDGLDLEAQRREAREEARRASDSWRQERVDELKGQLERAREARRQFEETQSLGPLEAAARMDQIGVELSKLEQKQARRGGHSPATLEAKIERLLSKAFELNKMAVVRRRLEQGEANTSAMLEVMMRRRKSPSSGVSAVPIAECRLLK